MSLHTLHRWFSFALIAVITLQSFGAVGAGAILPLKFPSDDAAQHVAISGGLAPPSFLSDTQGTRPAGVSQLTLRLDKTTLVADGQDTTLLVVLATDEHGFPAPNGTRVTFHSSEGVILPPQRATANGLAFARLQAGTNVGNGLVEVTTGNVTGTAEFKLIAPPEGILSLNHDTADPTNLLPASLNDITEQARNAIEVNGAELPTVQHPSHAAAFGAGYLSFTVRGTAAPALSVHPTLTVETAQVSVGGQPLYANAERIPAQVVGNVAGYARSDVLLEEFVARDSGIEQRWTLTEPPSASGDLVVAVTLQTELAATVAEGGGGVLLHSVDSASGAMLPVVRYGRAVAIDADGQSRHAELELLELETAKNGERRYQVLFTIPGDWLAQVSYPLLVDPLISSLLHIDDAPPAANQTEPAVAYNSSNEEFLVVWQDDRNGTADILAQRLAADGSLIEENFTVNSDSGVQAVPDVAYNPAQGTYLAVWRSGSDGIWGQVISSTGSLSGPALNLGGTLTNTRDYPAVAYSSTASAWLVTWQEWNNSSGSYEVLARAVADDGTLQTPFTVAGSGEDGVLPDVVGGSGGEFLVAWEQAAGSDRDIYAQRVTSSTLSGSALVLTSTVDSQVAPAVTYNSNDNEYLVVWQDLSGSDTVWGQRVSSAGALVGSAFQSSPTSPRDYAKPVVTYFVSTGSTAAHYLVGWQSLRGGTYEVQAQRVLTDGTSSGAAIRLDTGQPETAYNVAFGYGPVTAETIAVWVEETSGATGVFSRRVTTGGSMSNVLRVHPAPDDQELPQVAYNPDDDEYLVVWHDYRHGEANPDIYAQRVTGGGVLVGENITVTAQSYRQLYPQVAYAQGEGAYLVAWRHYTSSDDRDYNVYGQVISRTGALSGSALAIADGGGSRDHQHPTDIVTNSSTGKLLVLYEDGGNNPDIWGRHVSTSGVMDAPIEIASSSAKETGAVAAYNADQDQYLLAWVSDGADVLGRRMTGGGVVTVTETISVGVGSDEQRAPDVGYLGDGRYVVVFETYNSTIRDSDVQGQVVLTTGATEGSRFTLSGTTTNETVPQAASDGTGGALVIWQQREGTDTTDENIHGVRLGSDGQPSGAPFVILEDAADQIAPVLAGDGAGQYLLVWQDQRNGHGDIYGQPFQPLRAHFSASSTDGSPPLGVQFSDLSTPVGVADIWRWDFGDGGNSSQQHPVYTYTVSGAYTVTLAITDTETGETDTVTQASYITVGGSTALAANFTATPTSGEAPLEVTFTDLSTPGGAVDLWNWDFGDGSTSSDQNPVHTYTSVGVFTVTLTVTDTEVSETDMLVRSRYITVTTSTLDKTWQTITTTTAPPVDGEYAMAYDSGRDMVVFYGGNGSGWPYENGTWEFDGSDWTQVSTTQQPNAVYGMAMAYDADRSVMVLFGGSDSADGELAETWEYDGTDWTQTTPTTSPPARTGTAMVFGGGNLYLFGGNDEATTYSDLWQYDGTTWSQVSTGTAPLARTLTAMAYHAGDGKLYLFGGRDDSGDELDDFWTFEPTARSWSEINATGPTARYAHSMAYDASSASLVLLGGATATGDTVRADTWHYQVGSEWIESTASSLPPTSYHKVAVTNQGMGILLFNDGLTWRYQ